MVNGRKKFIMNKYFLELKDCIESVRKIMYDIEERDVSMSMEDPLYYLSVELTKAKQLIEDIRTKLMGKGIIC